MRTFNTFGCLYVLALWIIKGQENGWMVDFCMEVAQKQIVTPAWKGPAFLKGSQSVEY